MSLAHYFRVSATDDILVLELRDGISSLADHSILNELSEIRQKRREIGFVKLVIDLAHAPFFGSSLLELIRVVWNDISADGGELVLCNPSPVGREVLQVAKFDQIWPLMDTRDEALTMLGSARNVSKWPQALQHLIVQYDAGPILLRESLAGLTSIQLRTPAPPGVWSALQIVCHIADFELVYADRMKRVVAEDKPTMFGGDPDVFAEKLAYRQRHVDEELDVITAVRRQTARFLRTLPASDFERTGIHSEDGALTLQRLLERIAGHIPHHVKFIEGKRQALQDESASGK